jgi:folate-dependent tRNA-U54 methylase TrmFO/GidA
MRKKTVWALGLLTAATMGAAIAAVGPTGPGQFYYYYDANGAVVGYQAIDCDGTHQSWGKFTKNYADGYFICDPDPR